MGLRFNELKCACDGDACFWVSPGALWIELFSLLYGLSWGDLESQGWDYWFYQSRTTADNGAKVLARVEGKHWYASGSQNIYMFCIAAILRRYNTTRYIFCYVECVNALVYLVVTYFCNTFLQYSPLVSGVICGSIPQTYFLPHIIA